MAKLNKEKPKNYVLTSIKRLVGLAPDLAINHD